MEKQFAGWVTAPLSLAAFYLLTVQCLCLPGPWWFRLFFLPCAILSALFIYRVTRKSGTFVLRLPAFKRVGRFRLRTAVSPVLVPHRRVTSLLIAAVLGSVLAAVAMYRSATELDSAGIGLRAEQVITLEGVLVKDAWVSGNGEIVCMVSLTGCADSFGRSSRGGGLVRLSLQNDNIPRAADSRISARVDGLDAAPNRTWHWYARGVETGRSEPAGLPGLRARIVMAIERALDACSPEVKGFALALLLGRQDELTTEMEHAFYASGCAHLVALSGMHIALIGMLLNRLFGPFFGGIASRVLSLAGTSFFIWIAGPYPSALRALCMFTLLQCARIAGYKLEVFSSLCLSVPILGCFEPLLPLSLGFLLSFGALAGLLLLESGLRKPVLKILRPVGAREIAAGLAAHIGTLPLVSLRNMAFYPQGLIAGILLGPPVLLFMGLAAVQLVCGLVFPGASVPGVPFMLRQLYTGIAWLGGVFAG